MMLNKSEMKILGIVAIIIILSLSIIIIGIYNNEEDEEFVKGEKLINVSVGLDDPSMGTLRLGKEILGLDNDSISNITGDTFKLEIEVIDDNISYKIKYNWNALDYWGYGNSSGETYSVYDPNWPKYIFVKDPKINFNYLFIIRYLINSSDPDILNLSNMGLNNTIHGSFFITNSWEIKISITGIYLKNVRIIDNSTIQIPLDQYIWIEPGITHWH